MIMSQVNIKWKGIIIHKVAKGVHIRLKWLLVRKRGHLTWIIS